MSRSVNKVTLVGNVGRDPEVRQTQGGTKVANTSLATTYKYGEKEETDWHRLVFWDKLAEVVEKWVKKGDRIYIEGRIKYGSYDKDGITYPTTEIHVREMVMLGGSKQEEEPAAKPRPEPQPDLSLPEDDDLPF